MATIGQLVYEIGANTQGLNQAVGAINRMATVLGNLDASITRMDQTFTRMLGNATANMNNFGGAVNRNANQIQNQMDRATASFIKTSDQVDKLNTAISRAGANPQLIQNNINAFFALDAEMRNVNNTTAQLAVARAIFNSTLSDSTRQLNDTITAQKAFDAQLKIAEQSEIRQTNALERMRIKYEELKQALEDRKATSSVQALDQAFQHFEQQMKSGTLDAQKFATEMQKMNKVMANMGRSGGMKIFGGKLMDIVSSSQVALGPLSGVASRISAFSAIASRGGLVAAGFIGGIIGIGAALLKASMAGAEFEQQQLRISAAIVATGNEMGTTTKEVEKFAQDADAALTGIDIGKIREIMSNVISVVPEFPKEKLTEFVKQAQGISFLGRGDAESSSRRLAKLYADPLNNLNALTDAGIKFNSMEERQIQILTEMGDKEGVRLLIEKKLAPLVKMATKEGNGLVGAWDDFGDAMNKFFEVAGSSGTLQEDLIVMVHGFTDAIKLLGGEFGASGELGWAFGNVLQFIGKMAKEIAAGLISSVSEIHRMIQAIKDAGNWIAKTAHAMDRKDFILRAIDIKLGFVVDDSVVEEAFGTGFDLGEAINKGIKKAVDFGHIIKDALDEAIKKVPVDPLKRIAIDAGKTLSDLAKANFGLSEAMRANSSESKVLINQLEALDKAGQLDGLLKDLGLTREQMNILVNIMKNNLSNAIGQAGLELLKQQDELKNILKSEEERAVLAAEYEARTRLILQGVTNVNGALDRQVAIAGELARIPFEEQQKQALQTLDDQIVVLQRGLDLASATEGVRKEELAHLQDIIELTRIYGAASEEELRRRKEIRDLNLATEFQDEQRALQHQLDTQNEQLRTMFQSDATAERSMARFEKEFELRQKYKGVLDEAYQTELATFDVIQKRAAFIEEEMQALDDMMSSVLDSAKSALQDIFFNAGEGLQGIFDDLLKKIDDILLDLVFKQLQDVLGAALGDMLSGIFGTDFGIGLGEKGSYTNPMWVSIKEGLDPIKDIKDAIDPSKDIKGAVDPCSCISDLPGAVGDGVKKATDAADTASSTADAISTSVPDAIKKAAPEIVEPIAEVCAPLVEPIEQLAGFEPVFENLSQFGEAASSMLPTPDMTFTGDQGLSLIQGFATDFPDLIDIPSAIDPLKDLLPGFEEYIQTIPDAWVEQATDALTTKGPGAFALPAGALDMQKNLVMPTDMGLPIKASQYPVQLPGDTSMPLPPGWDAQALTGVPGGAPLAPASGYGSPLFQNLTPTAAPFGQIGSMFPTSGATTAQMPFSSAFTESGGVPTGAEDLVSLSKDSTDAITKWTDTINGSSTKVPLFDETLTRAGGSMDRLSDTSIPDVGASLDAFSTQGTAAATEGMVTNSTAAITSAASLDTLAASATSAAGAVSASGAAEGGGAGAGIFSVFGFASGGYLPPGDIGMVGEQGPELIYGGSSGATIAPMGTSTDSDHQVNLINNTSMQMTKTQKTTEDGRGRRRTDVLLEEVYSTSATGTQPRKTMNDFYGIRPRLIRA